MLAHPGKDKTINEKDPAKGPKEAVQSHQKVMNGSDKTHLSLSQILCQASQARREVGSLENMTRETIVKEKEKITFKEDLLKVSERRKMPTWRQRLTTEKEVVGGAGGGSSGQSVRHTAARTGGSSVVTDPLLIVLFGLEDIAALIDNANAAYQAYLGFSSPMESTNTEEQLNQKQALLLEISSNAWQVVLDATNSWPDLHAEVFKVMRLQEGRVLLWSSQHNFIRAKPHSAQFRKAFMDYKSAEIEQAKLWLDKVMNSELAKAVAAAQAAGSL